MIKYNKSKSHLSLIPLFYLLKCRGAKNLKKMHYRSHASDPMTWIFNDMINTGCELFWLIRLLVENKTG